VAASVSSAASVSKIEGISQGYQWILASADPINVRLISVGLKYE